MDLTASEVAAKTRARCQVIDFIVFYAFAERRLNNAALTGDDLRDVVNGRLFPYLAGFKQRASGPNTIEYKIGEVFGEIKDKIAGGYCGRC